MIAAEAGDGSVVCPRRILQAHHGRTVRYLAYLGFEPGGQVELSVPKTASVCALEAHLTSDLRNLRKVCAVAGVLLTGVSVDPWRSCREVGLQVRRRRYLEMQRHFDRIGPQGRAMMRLTASTQICLDWWPGSAGREQWLVSNLAGPFLAAAFANPPVAAGGEPPANPRLAIWLDTDPGRTAFDASLVTAEPVAAYTRLAAAAQVFAMPSDRGKRPEAGASFRTWWRDAAVRQQADISHHLSTIFPPVRPRGTYLEVRYLDSQPDAQIAVVAAVLACLLYDDRSRHAALRQLTGAAWDAERAGGRSARLASAAPELVETAGDLLALARNAVTRAPAGYLPTNITARLVEVIEQLKASADSPHLQVA
jgi:glutamate--cysteine ligase